MEQKKSTIHKVKSSIMKKRRSVFFDENYKGKITDIRVIDKDGDIVAVDNKVYERTTNKALYVAFKHEFTEV